MSTSFTTGSHRIFGIGNAGVELLDQLLLDYPEISGLVGLNRDEEQMMASVVADKIELSESLSLAEAWEAAIPQVDAQLQGVPLVILSGGLGGGLASRLIPMIAKKSKKAGALTIACVSYPYSFEAKRVRHLAAQSLEILEQVCDGIVLVENDLLCQREGEKSFLGETFQRTQEAIKQLIPALLTLYGSKSPVRIAKNRFFEALGRKKVRLHFGVGKARGGNRLYEAWEKALQAPLLEGGKFLREAEDIFLLLRAPADLSFSEAQRIMYEVEQLAGEEVEVQLGIETNPHEKGEGASLEVLLMALKSDEPPSSWEDEWSLFGMEKKNAPPVESLHKESLPYSSQQPVAKSSSNASTDSHSLPIEEKIEEKKKMLPVEEPAFGEVIAEQEETSLVREETQTPIQSSKSIEPIKATRSIFPETPLPEVKRSEKPRAKKSTPKKSEELPLEELSRKRGSQRNLNLTAAQRGRFDKSEPTIVEGEDLDIPTYLRRGIKLS